jgi:fumarate hydratase class II
MGEVSIPEEALWGAQTQRALLNFMISGQRMHPEFIHALALIKAAAANVNAELGLLDPIVATAIRNAAKDVAAGNHDLSFPIDVFQTGSGTSSNMNANEVIATLASRQLNRTVHANDHVNASQSSNDVIPSAIQVAAATMVHTELLPNMRSLEDTIRARANELADVVKTGRTHLMDALPLTFGQEFGAWAAQIKSARERLGDTLRRVQKLPIGGTAIGTGINAHRDFGSRVCAELARELNISFVQADNLFEGIAAKDECVELSGQLKTLACAVMKIANDLRWMNSGPLAGLGEIELKALQPGSSIMPGKVNPVIPEATCMVCAQVIGNDTAITIAGQSGNFQLNVMLPLIARNLLESIDLLAAVIPLLGSSIATLNVRHDRVAEALSRNPILVTALNPIIGYDKAAACAKRAYAEGRLIIDVVKEMTDLPEAELKRLLDPLALTNGSVSGVGGGG